MASWVVGGRYVLLSELGRERAGAVWRAEDRMTGRQVAVRELRLPDGLPAADRLRFRDRLLREARRAGRLAEPGVVAVQDVVTDRGPDGAVRDHVVTELADARSLTEVVAADGPLDERAAAAMGRQVLAVLRRSHGQDVVHRDVRPDNVLLGPGGRVGLTDTGIVRAAAGSVVAARVGSPGYMSPEQLAGGEVTPAADLWSLGATLYHALEAGEPPRRAATADAGEAPALRCGEPLRTVITGLLRDDPGRRLTAEQAAALLAEARPQGAGRARTPRVPAWAVVAAVVVVAFVLGVAVGAVLFGVP